MSKSSEEVTTLLPPVLYKYVAEALGGLAGSIERLRLRLGVFCMTTN